MAKRRPGTGADAGPGLRERLRQDYAERLARTAGWGAPAFSDGAAELVLAALANGRPVVLSSSELARYRLDEVEPGRHAWYQVGPDGQVLEVVPQRDPADPDSITGWEPR